MSDPATPDNLCGELTKLWVADSDKPKAAILLATQGRDYGSDLRAIAEGLGIAYIHLRLGQVVTPEQHMLFTQDKPRLIALSHIDRLTPSERDALARLVYKGPRTLPVILCPVEQEQLRGIKEYWSNMQNHERENDGEANPTSDVPPIKMASAGSHVLTQEPPMGVG